MDSKQLAWKIRYDVLQMDHHAHASHIGSAYSVSDILAVLFAQILSYRVQEPKWSGRDRLVLSKGHAGAALYAALAEVGFFSTELLDHYCDNGNPLSGHISHKGVPGIEFSTGSLGHGVCVATGMALAGKLNHEEHHVYAIVGDGECDEGAFWETILFAHQYQLNNYTIIIDRNHIQAMGDCQKVMDTGNLFQKIKDFGWNTIEIDGNNHDQILKALKTGFDNDLPICIIANTIKGKGISFMENQLLWHYRDPQGEFYDQALKELEAAKDAK